MSEKKTLIVAAVMPNHPSGTRRRAGFVFGVDPVVYEVTEEQRKEILADQFLRIITKGTALDDAMQAYKKKSEGSSELSDIESAPSADASNSPENLAPAAWNDPSADEDKESGFSSEPAPSDASPAEPAAEAKPVSRMNKDELIAELEKKGLVAGKDFEPAASNKKLAALLSSL